MQQKVTLHRKEDTLVANLFSCEHPSKAAVFIHGWNSFQNEYYRLCAKELSSIGCMSLTFDLRGHGESSGHIDDLEIDDYLDDVLLAYDFLADQTKREPYLVGASFGAYLAALATEKRHVSGLGLRCPANYPDEDLSKKESKKWRSKELSWQETASLRAVHNYTGPVIIVESENDTVIPRQAVQNYAQAVSDQNKLTYHCLPGAKHGLYGDPINQKSYLELLAHWVQNN